MPIDDIIAKTTGTPAPGASGNAPTMSSAQQRSLRRQNGIFGLSYEGIASRWKLDRDVVGFIATVAGLLLNVVKVV